MHGDDSLPGFQVKELDSRLLGKCMLAEDSDSELVEVNLIPRGLQVLPRVGYWGPGRSHILLFSLQS